MPRIRNLTREQRRGEDGFDLHQKIIVRERERRISLIKIGGLLYEIKKQQLFKDILGDEQAKWSAYLSQTEIMFSRHKVKYLLQIHSYFILQRQISPEELARYPLSRIIEIIKYANSDEKINSLLQVAAVALPQDWRDTINELRGKIPSEDCNHLFENIKVCENCGKKVKQ